MNLLQKHLDKNNLHHAYLIEGSIDTIWPEVLNFAKDMEVTELKLDTFKIDDARSLKSLETFRATDRKKAFVIYANNFLLEAQNSLLKMFEEPIENTHFFVILPDVSGLLDTFVSRFYVIRHKPDLVAKQDFTTEAEKFIKMPLRDRLEYIKSFLAESEDVDEDVGEVVLESTRARAQKFLNSIEVALHLTMSRGILDSEVLHHLFKVREFLRTPGSSTKTLLESVAIVMPVL